MNLEVNPACFPIPEPIPQRIQQAIYGKHGLDQQRIVRVGLEWIELLLKKNSDYGSSVFQSPPLLPSLTPGDAILIRMGDKIGRLCNLSERLKLSTTPLAGPEIAESFDDTIRDLGAYCLLYLIAVTPK